MGASIFVIVVLLVYLAILNHLHELGLPNLDLKKYCNKSNIKVLVIFPHPDDETMATGGLISKMTTHPNCMVKVVSLTCGEKGNEKVNTTVRALAEIRKNEFVQAMKVLRVNDYEICEFNDGKLNTQQKALTIKLEQLFKSYGPDLVITYEKNGLYGHPDHMILSQMVSNLIKNKYKQVKILYVTLSKNIIKHIRLPYHMSQTGKVVQTSAEFKLNICDQVFNKFRAAKVYRSQNITQGKPLIVMAAFGIFEYYTSKFD